jgi:hypothetical protein
MPHSMHAFHRLPVCTLGPVVVVFALHRPSAKPKPGLWARQTAGSHHTFKACAATFKVCFCNGLCSACLGAETDAWVITHCQHTLMPLPRSSYRQNYGLLGKPCIALASAGLLPATSA